MIYVDLVYLINLTYDFLILSLVNIVLRRNIKFKRLIIGSFIGSLSIITIFISSLSNIYFILIFSFLMIIITFGYKDIIYLKNNILYFYMISIIFGGFLYFVNLKFKYIFNNYNVYNGRVLLNFLGIMIASPIVYILYKYTYSNKEYKHSNYYSIKVSINNYLHNLTGFYDTGNLIKDPYKGRPVIIVEKEILYGDIKNKSPIYVPFKMLNNNGLLKCFKPDILIINDKVINNCLIGLWEDKLMYDGVNAVISGFIGDKIK